MFGVYDIIQIIVSGRVLRPASLTATLKTKVKRGSCLRGLFINKRLVAQSTTVEIRLDVRNRM